MKPANGVRDFSAAASLYLQRIQEQIEEKVNPDTSEQQYNVYQFKVNSGEYVLNKQGPERQLWLSSPLSGPSHYDYVKGRFINRKNGIALSELLSRELQV